ncbi:MAG: RNA polymerase factor sigma-54 [Peptococcaceae bacterium]|jgi:RNA polymerase sigma-54 factor|nr:RNA polymerase factor sigma-54 [Peptococcaceae bacterium]MDH7524751.1 RNA polymerase factor sigma-54 [Peptococcaceae bacterium]
MNINYGLRLEQTQKLVMTPELRQAIKILQLSSLELTDYVNQMLTENPLIEINEEEIYPRQEKEQKKEAEIDWEDYLQETRDLSEPRQPQEVKTEFSFENFITRGTSLHEYLLSQLGYLRLNREESRIARYLIGNIDSSGYLAVTVEQASLDLKTTGEKIEKVLAVIQGFDPIGVGARSLSECLLIQLKQKGVSDPALYELVEKHLENIAAGKLSKVAQVLNLPITKVQEMADLIKTLNPRPGASFGGDDVRYIVPDVLVERIDNDYIILVNDNHIPHLTINKTYSAILKKSSEADDVTRGFVENKLNQALWLIRSIEQRRMTIYQVASALVSMQRQFFDHGIKHLKPLTLKQVAERINVHESTVSRATANKYIQTPHGIFEFKFFFNSGLNTDKGESASSESIRRLLQEIIREENPCKPYSDQKLADILNSRGIRIARRTVTKYREGMGIPNTGFRKRY